MMSSTFRHLSRGLWLLLLVALAGPASAQERGDGSLYSRFGFGELQQMHSSQLEALGGIGPGLRSASAPNYGNPASFSAIALVHAAAGFQYQNVTISDAADASSQVGRGYLGAVQLSFPLLERKLGLGLSFSPYSRVGYRVRQEGVLTGSQISAADSAGYLVEYEGTGGLQRFQAGLGYQLTPALSIGAGLDVLFGIVENGRRTSFLLSGFDRSVLTTSTRLHGVTGTVGALFRTAQLANDEDALTLGAAVRLPVTLDGERVLTLGESLDRDTLGTRLEGSADLPLSATVGATYRADSRWLINIGALYEPWSGFSSDLGLPPGTDDAYRDRLRVGGGVELVPAGRDITAGYLARAGYRLGAYYDRAYVTPLAGQDLRTLALTAGISFPTLLPGTRLDVNMEAGTRGTTEMGLVHDRFFKLGATLNVGERWFQKQKLR